MEKNLGHATAYGYAKSKGYTGTEEEFGVLMASYASVAQDASHSASSAAEAAQLASNEAQTASQAAQTATSKASEAVTAAGTATTKASEASQSASTASTAATSAGTSAQTATTAASTATAKASEASESATTASTAKTDAETARNAAAQSASEAAASAASIDPDEFDRKIYAAFATDTATGAVASFPDGADSIPMKDVLVHVEPVQDLHGYDSPWPAGGGKNKLLPRTSDISETTSYGITYSYNVETETLTMSGTNSDASAQVLFMVRPPYFIAPEDLKAGDSFWFAAIIPVGAYSQIVYKKKDTNVVTKLKTLDGTGQFQASSVVIPDDFDGIARVDVGVKASETISGTVKLMLSLGNSAPTEWTPYSNICPITGWTGAKVTRCGKNLAPRFLLKEKTAYGLTLTPNGDGSIRIHGTPTNGESAVMLSRRTFAKGDVVFPAGSYTFNRSSYSVSDRIYIQAVPYKGSSMYSRNAAVTYTYTEDFLPQYLDIGVNPTDGTPIDITIFPQLELGSTATDYEPYSGQTYDITFPSEAGTVYGGTLDVTSGVLTVDRAIIASYAGETLPSTWISDRDVYSAGATPITGAQVVYELASPITYTLTPQEITSLLGENNLWADTGDSDVTYCVDPTLLSDNESSEIQSIKSMIAGVEFSAVATKNYSIGDLVIVEDTLYEVTAAIALGETISVSNTVVTTADDVIKNRITMVDNTIKNRIADSIDATLTQSGQAADAKATGDAITELKNDLGALFYDVTPNENGEFIWPLRSGYWQTESDSVVWHPVTNNSYLSSPYPIKVKSGDIIHIKDGINIRFFAEFSADGSTWAILSNTTNHDVSILSDGYVLISAKKGPITPAFTDEDIRLFFEKYLTIYRKIHTNKNAKRIDNINDVNGIVVNEVAYAQSYVTASASTTEGGADIPIEFSASKGETFIIKADFSVTHPEFFGDIKLSIRERHNNVTIGDTRYDNLSEPIEYTVKQTSTTSIIFIVVWVKESDSSVTTSYYENFDYRICVAKKNDELSDVITESGETWEV